MGTQPPPQKRGAAPAPKNFFSAHVYCAQKAGCITMPLGMEVGSAQGTLCLTGTQPPSPKRGLSSLSNFRPMSIVAKRLDGSRWHLAWRWPWSRLHCARWETSSPPPKRGQSPQFSAHFYCRQTSGGIKMALGMEVGFGPSHIVLDGAPAPLLQKGTDPQFLAHFYCRQMAGCIKMPLGMEVGLSPGDSVLDGDPASPPPKGHSPNFCPMWPNDWMKDATWYGSRPRPRPHCIIQGASSARKGHSSPPSFRPMSVVATVTHLIYC